jgi:hypothetical protein
VNGYSSCFDVQKQGPGQKFCQQTPVIARVKSIKEKSKIGVAQRRSRQL